VLEPQRRREVRSGAGGVARCVEERALFRAELGAPADDGAQRPALGGKEIVAALRPDELGLGDGEPALAQDTPVGPRPGRVDHRPALDFERVVDPPPGAENDGPVARARLGQRPPAFAPAGQRRATAKLGPEAVEGRRLGRLGPGVDRPVRARPAGGGRPEGALALSPERRQILDPVTVHLSPALPGRRGLHIGTPARRRQCASSEH
jgi:hypothetical protein